MQKITLHSTKIDATISLSADDWQLYSDVEGRDKAAASLNRDLERHLRDGNINGVGAVLWPYSKWGATDTEGWATLAQVLRTLGLDDERLV